MPLLDHFHLPIAREVPWESFHSNWATRIADVLNERWLSPEYLATEYTQAGSRLEIDVATFERSDQPAAARTNGPVAATLPHTWTPPRAQHTMPAVFPDHFEVRIFSTGGGMTLVGAIELVSPGNKDQAEERLAFATKCASYLHQGVSVVLIDVVTKRRPNLHNEIIRLMRGSPDLEMPAEVELYATAYRPVLREERPEIDLWTAVCQVGEPLPTMPLRLAGDLFVPVEFEASYQEACRRRRLG